MSKIEWTTRTWNSVAGRTIVSAGCTNCYAMRMAARLEAMGMGKYAGLTRKSGGRRVWTGKVNLDETALDTPRSWRKPGFVFVNSMSDLFHPSVPVEFIAKVWAVMEATPSQTYQILTKRPARMREVLSDPAFPVLSNVWLGTSVDDGKVLDRIDMLRDVPAAVRFVSFEPLIGSVAAADLTGVDWAIIGGESGPGARPLRKEWVFELLHLCRADGVAFFFKQWGGPVKKRTGRLLNGRTYDEMPNSTQEGSSVSRGPEGRRSCVRYVDRGVIEITLTA